MADVYDRDNLLMRRRLCFLCVCSQGLWANQSVSVCAPQWLMATPSSSECETQNKGFEAECAKNLSAVRARNPCYPNHSPFLNSPIISTFLIVSMSLSIDLQSDVSAEGRASH